MDKQYLETEFNTFFEFDSDDRSVVTSTSAKMFAEHMALLLTHVYMPADFPMPSLLKTVREAHDQYESINIFLRRNKPYNPSGRNQNEEEARVLDQRIKNMLNEQEIEFTELEQDRGNVATIIEIMHNRSWI